MRIVATAVVLLVVLMRGAFVAGLFGVPSVETVQNRFGDVNETTTTTETTTTIDGGLLG